MKLLGLLGRVILGALTVIVLLVIALGVAISVGIPISLDSFRGEFESMASTGIGRAVTIEGKMVVVPTLWPTLEIEGLRIAQPDGWPDELESGVEGGGFARAEHAFLRLGIVPLLKGKLHVLELTGEGFEVDMEKLPDGRNNWSLDLPEAQAAEVVAEELPPGVEEPLLLELLAIDGIAFRDVRLRYRDPGASWEYELTEMKGVIAVDADFELSMRGTLQGEDYSLSFKGDPLDALFTRDEPWPVNIEMEVGGAELKLAGLVSSRWLEDALLAEDEAEAEARILAQMGPFQFRALDLDVELKGERLDRFNRIAGFGLPPLGPYHLGGTLVLRDGRYTISDLLLSVASSRLTGKMSWDHLGKLPRIDVALRAPNIQLADFPWLEKRLEKDGEEEDSAKEELPTLFSPEILRTFNAALRVDVDRVVSGKDKLGGMHLVSKLEGGRVQVDPFTLEVPGGSVAIHFSYVDRAKEASLELGVDLSRFDYGVLARFIQPETQMQGLVSLDVDLKAHGKNATVMMNNAEGQIDLALVPAEFEAGVIDLWSVNLIASVLPVFDTGKKSVVECLIAQLDVRDGKITEHVLLVDTTRMRVTGKALIDIEAETIDLNFSPVAKRPEFFSVATPVHVEGDFEDFEVVVRPEDLLGTVIRFVTSVVVVPVQRFIGLMNNLSDEAVCQKALDRVPLEPS